MRFVLSLLGALLVMLPSAFAQQATPATPPMQFRIMRGAGDCEPNCPEWIAAQGEIKADTQQKLRRMIQSLKGRKLPIMLHSPGGHVDSGLAMGRMIREAGLTTAIGTSSLPSPCAPKDTACLTSRRKGPLKGQFNLVRAYCASACTFMLAGGTKRVVHPTARLGVHQMTFMVTPQRIYRRYRIQYRIVNGRKVEVSRTLISERVVTVGKAKQAKTPEREYAKLNQHFQKMGIGPSFGEMTRTTSAQSMRFLTPEEKRDTSIATDTADLITALGFDPTNTHFTAPARVGMYFGFKDVGTMNGEATTLEVTADPDAKASHEMVSVRILQDGKAIDARNIRLDLLITQRAKAEAFPNVDRPNDVLVFSFQRADFCSFRGNEPAVISLHDRANANASPLLIRAGRLRDLIPIEGVLGSLCPQRHWER
jgi:hypothetical protein